MTDETIQVVTDNTEALKNALDEIESLRQQLADAEAQIPRWIPVEERLPDDMRLTEHPCCGHWYTTKKRVWVTDGKKVSLTKLQVWPDKGETHSLFANPVVSWMPYVKPLPPTEQEGKGE